ncbi:N-acetylglucosamine-6-phosphate deacetylase [Dongia deserti]|uniref:N-acetylglucosamine-6-phosphate deacetylase n=1 Tax=Dongia deserti TaxID=2268030 RepID=UPI000E64A17E|nr:N-acetylglucosamine-6-phosphate deacetylase [Dongia deserti]
MTRFAIAGAEIFDGTKRRPLHAVVVDGARILDVVQESVLPGDLPVQRLPGGVLAPGFIDAQANGGGGVLLNDAPTADGVRTICDAHGRFGTTALLPTLITDSPAITAKAVASVKQAIANGTLGCLGLHLEGPFLSPERRGAHDASLIRTMTDADVDEILSLGIETLLITVSPERIAPAIIRRLVDGGAIVSLGHSNATYDQILTAVDAGARGVTHIFNAMSPMTHRAPGVVGGALDSGELWCGLIADGHHVHPAAIGIALRAKRQPGRIFLVTDAMSTVGSGQQTITLNGRTVWRRNGALELEDGTLAGSDLDMMSGVRYLVKQVGVELGEALRMASTYPAEFLKRPELGGIAAGARADLVHIDDDLKAKAIWRAGVRLDA